MAALPPNLNIPAPVGANPALQNSAVENQAKQNLAELEPPKITVQRRLRNTFNISEMLLALPLLANSFVLQADNISDQTKLVENPGAVGHVASTYKTLSSVFKALIDKFIAGGKTIDNIDSNRSANLTQNFRKRILHPNITKEFTSLLFNTRRIVFNLLPNMFTVPSAEHDPLNPDGNTASKTTATLYGILAHVMNPLIKTSSLFAALTTIPSHLMGSYFTYTGNEEAYNSTKYFNRISEIFTPLLSNLSSLLSVSKSYIDSYFGDGVKSLSKFVTRGRYNVGKANMIQGLVGSVTSLPYFLGALGKLRDVVHERDTDNNSKFSTNLKNLADNVLPKLAPWIQKINPSYNVDDHLNGFKQGTEAFISNTDKTIKSFLSSVYNANPFIKNLASKIRPSDSIGNVQALADSHTDEAHGNTGYTFGLIKKSSFFREIFDWLHPLQSMLMLLPNSVIEPEDPYVKDNSKRLGRRLDRLFGFNSMLLSFPNYLIYSASTRLPQMLLKFFEFKERQYQLSEAGDKNMKSGHQAYLDTVKFLKKFPIPGSDFLASKLESLGVDENTFIDEAEFRSIFEELDASARKQEASVKASELVGATRIGFRTLLERESIKVKGPKLFFADRDDQGLTDDERTRKKFYDSVGNFKNIVGKIPVVGWIASPIIEGFRKIYKVDTTERRNLVGTSAEEQKRKIMEALQQATAATQQAA